MLTSKFCDKSAKIIKKCAALESLNQEHVHANSSQNFDTSLKCLIFVTKFNKANLVVFGISDYYFADNSNNLRSMDYQESRF